MPKRDAELLIEDIDNPPGYLDFNLDVNLDFDVDINAAAETIASK